MEIPITWFNRKAWEISELNYQKFKKNTEILRRHWPEILRIEYFCRLFQKTNSISNSYEELSDDEKLNQLCEVLELTGKVQHEVFSVISTLSEASESDVMKSRLLPWISNGFLGEITTNMILTTFHQNLTDHVKKYRPNSIKIESQPLVNVTFTCEYRSYL